MQTEQQLTDGKALVLGASGFLGSHVTKQLVADGRDVRVLVRKTSDTRGTDDLDVERCYGDVLEPDSLAAAMVGCQSVFYCVVDTRAWLRDPTPLYRVNVDGLINAMEAALTAGVARFVFTSTFGTIGTNPSGVASEADAFNWWDQAPEYIRCRVVAENRFMEYCRDRGLPGVAACIGNTYGSHDYAPTPHGKLVADTARGKMPIYWDAGGPSVGITDAAKAMVLAEQKGRIGERYIISERYISFKDLFKLAADAAGVKPPPVRIPIPVLYSIAAITDGICKVLGKDNNLSVSSIKCSRMNGNLDTSKAREELGWQPRPLEESVKEAVAFYLETRT